MMKKKEGSMMKLLPVLLGVVVVSIMTMMYLSYMSDYDKKEYADMVAREYILMMETKGYLSYAEGMEIVTKLRAAGFENISLAGTSLVKADYSSEIKLCINARLKGKEFVVNNLFDAAYGTVYRELNICKTTTAKY